MTKLISFVEKETREAGNSGKGIQDYIHKEEEKLWRSKRLG